MKKVLKKVLFAASALMCTSLLLSSCQKSASGSFEGYFYLSQPIKNATSTDAVATINIDGTNYGTVKYISGTVTTSTQGLNIVKLPCGTHDITIYDASNHAIISGYIQYSDNEMGSGSWGNAGGGMECSGSGPNDPNMLVGMFQ